MAKLRRSAAPKRVAGRIVHDIVLARSPTGVNVKSFQTLDIARNFLESHPDHSFKLVRQQIVEQEIAQ